MPKKIIISTSKKNSLQRKHRKPTQETYTCCSKSPGQESEISHLPRLPEPLPTSDVCPEYFNSLLQDTRCLSCQRKGSFRKTHATCVSSSLHRYPWAPQIPPALTTALLGSTPLCQPFLLPQTGFADPSRWISAPSTCRPLQSLRRGPNKASLLQTDCPPAAAPHGHVRWSLLLLLLRAGVTITEANHVGNICQGSAKGPGRTKGLSFPYTLWGGLQYFLRKKKKTSLHMSHLPTIKQTSWVSPPTFPKFPI